MASLPTSSEKRRAYNSFPKREKKLPREELYKRVGEEDILSRGSSQQWGGNAPMRQSRGNASTQTTKKNTPKLNLWAIRHIFHGSSTSTTLS